MSGHVFTQLLRLMHESSILCDALHSAKSESLLLLQVHDRALSWCCLGLL
jgi:hypothetical protein